VAVITFPASVEELIRQAIRQHRRLSISHAGLERVVEPRELIETADHAITLRAWQVGGQWRDTPPPSWCELPVAEVEWATPLNELF
jgi:hypothetical protein